MMRFWIAMPHYQVKEFNGLAEWGADGAELSEGVA
jgi:hypothetical protein